MIIRYKTYDFAYRIFDYSFERGGIDQIIVDVHNYYLVELVYVNDELQTYCNRIRDINTNGFFYNEAVIGSNINEVSDHYHQTYPPLGMGLTEGMKIKIVELTREYTNMLSVNSYGFKTYDYYYHILVDDRQVRINGYLLDFSNKIEYRSKLLILRSGNIPQATMPEEAGDYIGTWRYTGTGGIGIDRFRRTITITISEDEIRFHYAGHESEYGYTLADLRWTKIIRPDEDFSSWVEILNDHYKGISGYIITGTVIDNIGDWPDTDSIAEYVYIRPDNKDRMFWYNFSAPNYILVRQ